MNLFTSEDKLKKYDSVEEIIDDYFDIRLEYYEDRKDFMIESLEKELMILSNKAKYIQELLDGTIDLRKKKKQEIIDMIKDKEYDAIDSDEEFKYLVKMPMDSVSEENVEKLLKEHHAKQDELERINSTTIETMWLSELEILEHEYQEYQKERELSQSGDTTLNKKKKPVAKVLGGAKKVIKKSSAIQLEIV
jgi:DNA topoisomerase-2